MIRLGSLVGSQGKKIFFRRNVVHFLSAPLPLSPHLISPFSTLPIFAPPPPFLFPSFPLHHLPLALYSSPPHPFSPQVRSQALHHAQRRVKALQEQLQTLEDELEVPRQDLEEKKKEEMQRRKKVENFKKEIQVNRVCPACASHARMLRSSRAETCLM